MPSFTCLYYFYSVDLSVVEIKRTDLAEDAPLSERYKWLVVIPETRKVLELDFRSMKNEGDNGLRIFVEGEFRFNKVDGQLSLLGEKHLLECQNPTEVSGAVLNQIAEHLSENLARNDLYVFRPLKPSDVNFFKQWILDAEVIRYSMTRFHKISDESQIIDWFQTTLFDSKTFQLGIIDPASKELIGYAGIASINDVDGNGEYFIFIGNKSFWGRGIASSVTKEMVKIGFESLGLHRIFLTASSRNPGAIRAYEKAGFVHEGKMREAFFRNKEHSDKIIMGILRSEFETH